MARKIVILSESTRLRIVLRETLADGGYQVSDTSLTQCEPRAVAALLPDLIILDWYLGLEDQGLQVLQSLKLYEPLAGLPFIICSAPTTLVREMRDQLHRSNSQLLCKPFTLDELHAAVRSALSRPHGATLDTRVSQPARWLHSIAPAAVVEESAAMAASADTETDGIAPALLPDALPWTALQENGVSVS